VNFLKKTYKLKNLDGGAKMKKVFLSVLFFILICITNSYSEEDLTIMLNRVKPAVVLIVSQINAEAILPSREGPKNFPLEPLRGTGTGFIINPRGYIVTNGHVVQLYHEKNENQLYDYFLREVILKYFLTNKEGLSQEQLLAEVNRLAGELKGKIQIVIKKNLFVVLPNKKVYPAEIKIYSPPITPNPGIVSVPGFQYRAETGKDVAILKIEEKNLPIVTLGDSDEIKLGEPVYVAGYPGVVLSHPYLGPETMLESTVTGGRVSGVKVDVKGTPVIQTDAPLTWGNSGGPAFNSKGEVIGIATFISIKNVGESQQAIQGFNFLVPINTVKEFIRAAGVPINESSLFNKLWDEILNLYIQSKYKEALEKIEELNRIQEGMPDVLKLRKQIQERLSKGEGQEKAKSTIIIVIVIVSLIIIGGIAILIAKKRKKSKVVSPKPSTSVKIEEAPQKFGILIGESGPISGKTFEITLSGLKIGREPTKNNIVIDDNKVSREHAWVGPEDNEVVVKDLGSTNGTFVNSIENQITKYKLKDGDLIIIGKGKFATLRYKKV